MEIDHLTAIFRALEAHDVEYAVFGAVALGLHGLARTTADLDLFLAPERDNVERLKEALRSVFDDPNVDDISADDLCGDYPAVRYYPPVGFGLDILTRLGEAFHYRDLEIEVKEFEGTLVRGERADPVASEEGHHPARGSNRRRCAGRTVRARRRRMTVQRFRSIADMPKPWRSPDDPENLRLVAQMIALYWRLRGTPPEGPRVRRFRTVEEMNRDRDDFYRRDDPALARS